MTINLLSHRRPQLFVLVQGEQIGYFIGSESLFNKKQIFLGYGFLNRIEQTFHFHPIPKYII